jgi:thiosulfate dehydrogenase [quinone] large subunit
LQKLANPAFFHTSDPSGIHAQLIASARISPLSGLIGHLVHLSTPIGILIALAEVAVGLGTLLGLLTRVAAVGGLLLSLTLFLTVSFHSSPYYTGADIVFAFAWLPLILAGSGGVFSLDGVLAGQVNREARLGDPSMVAVRFSVVQKVCGNYEAGRCAGLHGDPCQVHRCPFLLADGRAVLPTAAAQDLDRRRFVFGAAAVAVVGAVGLALAGAATGLGRVFGGSSTGATGGVALPTPTTTPPAKSQGSGGSSVAGHVLGPSKDVPVGGAATFTVPANGDPGLVLQPTAGDFVAYDAVCPHAGCTVGWSSAANLILCPCHGSEFNPANGDVVRGPAPHGLTSVSVKVAPNGQLYVPR